MQIKKVNHGLRHLGYDCPLWFKPTLTFNDIIPQPDTSVNTYSTQNAEKDAQSSENSFELQKQLERAQSATERAKAQTNFGYLL